MNRRDVLLTVEAVREWVDIVSVLNHGRRAGTGRGVTAMLGMLCFARAGVEPVAILKANRKAISKPTRSKHKTSTDGSVGC